MRLRNRDGLRIRHAPLQPVAPCDQGQAIGGSTATPVSASFSSLSQGATYHYRLVLANPNGTFRSKDKTVSPSDEPVVESPYVDTVHSDSVLFHAEITPEGAPTTYHVLYGTGDCGAEPQTCDETPESSSVGRALLAIPASVKATGLSAGTTYHYVIVATNQSGSTVIDGRDVHDLPLHPDSGRRLRQRARPPADGSGAAR